MNINETYHYIYYYRIRMRMRMYECKRSRRIRVLLKALFDFAMETCKHPRHIYTHNLPTTVPTLRDTFMRWWHR